MKKWMNIRYKPSIIDMEDKNLEENCFIIIGWKKRKEKKKVKEKNGMWKMI